MIKAMNEAAISKAAMTNAMSDALGALSDACGYG